MSISDAEQCFVKVANLAKEHGLLVTRVIFDSRQYTILLPHLCQSTLYKKKYNKNIYSFWKATLLAEVKKDIMQ